MVCDTLTSQDAFTHQFWNSYLKDYRRYASDSMPILETRSGQDPGPSDPKMVCDTTPSKDAFKHQIWNSYLKKYRRHVPYSMPILETRSEVKVIVTQGWNGTLY